MKFEVGKSALMEGLQKVLNVVSLRTTLPILSNVLIEADKSSLTLTTTDLEVGVRCKVDAKVSKTGASTLPARRLSSIVRELPDGAIQVEVDDKNNANVKSGSSFFKIMGLSKDEFPPMPKAEGKHSYKMEQVAFREMLRKTSYAASTDETRYVLNGVLLSFKGGKLTMVATDGRRLALVEQEIDFPDDAQGDLILPSKAVAELTQVLGDEGELTLSATENQIMFQFDDVLVVSKLIDGTFPNYKQVIPAQCEERVTVERESLFTALRRVSLVTTDKSNAAKLTFGKNKVVISMNTPDIGEAEESLPVKYDGKEFSVAFNPEYMMDPLKTLSSDEVFLELTDELSPGVLKTDIPFLYVLMPMRIT
jgi:DNA polymerase-3 subunit beta